MKGLAGASVFMWIIPDHTSSTPRGRQVPIDSKGPLELPKCRFINLEAVPGSKLSRQLGEGFRAMLLLENPVGENLLTFDQLQMEVSLAILVHVYVTRMAQYLAISGSIIVVHMHIDMICMLFLASGPYWQCIMSAQFCHECPTCYLHVLCYSPVWANSDGHTPCIGNWCCHNNQLATGVDNRGHSISMYLIINFKIGATYAPKLIYSLFM